MYSELKKIFADPSPRAAASACADAPFAVEASSLSVERSRKRVLRNLHLAVAAGALVVLTGANGSGKTTLLHCLAGALRPSHGEAYWFGATSASAPEVRRRIGFLGHDNGLYLALTAQENLLFAGRMFGLDHLADRVDRLLQEIGLDHQRHRSVGHLSRGQRQRLALARAMIHEPSLLLLDEPFTSLDSAGRVWLTDCLQRLRRQGCAILVASHPCEEMTCDQRLRLSEGQLFAQEDAAGAQWPATQISPAWSD